MKYNHEKCAGVTFYTLYDP